LCKTDFVTFVTFVTFVSFVVKDRQWEELRLR
jgi:hypothetical protein